MIAAEVSRKRDPGSGRFEKSVEIAREPGTDPLTVGLQVHVGTQNCNSQMESYIYDRTREGVFYLDLAKTWEKTMVAARIIAAIQDKNKKDVLVSAAAICASSLAAIDCRVCHLGVNSWACIGRVLPRVRAESRAEVRHLHRRQLHGRKVGPRHADQPEHEEVSRKEGKGRMLPSARGACSWSSSINSNLYLIIGSSSPD